MIKEGFVFHYQMDLSTRQEILHGAANTFVLASNLYFAAKSLLRNETSITLSRKCDVFQSLNLVIMLLSQ